MRTRQWRQRGLLAALALSIVWTAVSGKGAGPAA
ncbi:MAG: hypothetical protein JWP22_1614, partial [Ramlibacter sp.]|nr:hypothetical protein [Ramlibacter sp.]